MAPGLPASENAGVMPGVLGISKSEYDAYQHSVPDGTTVRWYDAGHTFGASSVGDMLDWLAGELRLGPLPAYAHRLVAG